MIFFHLGCVDYVTLHLIYNLLIQKCLKIGVEYFIGFFFHNIRNNESWNQINFFNYFIGKWYNTIEI